MNAAIIALIVLGVLAGTAPPGEAQTIPVEGLFRIDPGAAVRASAIGVRASIYQAYDQQLLDAPQASQRELNRLFTVQGPYSGIDLNAGYQRRRPRSMLSLLATAEARYFPRLASALTDSYGAGGQWESRPSSRTSFTLGGLVARRSSFQFGSLADLRRNSAVETADPRDAAPVFVGVSSQAQSARTSLVHRFSGRSDLTVDYAFSRTQYDDVDLELLTHTAGTVFTRTLPRGFDTRLGYRFTEWNLHPTASDRATPRMHTIDAGLGYARDLGQRTALAASTGAVVVPRADESDTVRLALAASLEHTFSDRWRGGLRYGRGMNFLEGVAAPLSFDRVQGDLSGRLTQRLTASLSAAFTTGETSGRSYSVGEATASLDYQFQRIGIFGRYRLYSYDLASSSLLALGIPGAVRRHVLLVGLNVLVWTPIR